jgi:hypothetical protein
MEVLVTEVREVVIELDPGNFNRSPEQIQEAVNRMADDMPDDAWEVVSRETRDL